MVVHGIFSPEGVLFASATAPSIPVIVVVLCWDEKVSHEWCSARARWVHGHGRVHARGALGVSARPPNTKTPKQPPFSTRDNSTDMAPIDEALAAIESRELGEQIVY
jgi:hypothetical protein